MEQEAHLDHLGPQDCLVREVRRENLDLLVSQVFLVCLEKMVLLECPDLPVREALQDFQEILDLRVKVLLNLK